jgi:hypothetical protein
MCSKINRVHGSCSGRHLGADEGLRVGSRRKHFFTSYCLCQPRLEQYNDTGVFPGWCDTINEHTNVSTGTRIDCPVCKGTSHVLFWNVPAPANW